MADDLHEKPVADATVSLVNVKDSSLVAFTRTDSSGKFSFIILQPGGYRLSASHSKFYPLWKLFELAPNDEALLHGNLLMKDITV